ncbi:hypothetical protein BGX38DRAFT_1301241 [Terfezia claveryi]|nr:hypothetical protein BGX38DRAFT_1301241 [Terfezia claveryi]
MVVGMRIDGEVFQSRRINIKREREEEEEDNSDKENVGKRRKVEPVNAITRREPLVERPQLSVGWKGSLRRDGWRFVKYKKGDNKVRGIKREPLEEEESDWEVELPPVSSFLGGRPTPDRPVPNASPVEPLEYDLGTEEGFQRLRGMENSEGDSGWYSGLRDLREQERLTTGPGWWLR